jgi:hypothetical protein
MLVGYCCACRMLNFLCVASILINACEYFMHPCYLKLGQGSN